MLRAGVVAVIVAFSLSALGPLGALGDAPAGAIFQVGLGIRDITPSPAMSQDGSGNVYLGGFGFGPVRLSDGHEYPVRARAIVIGDGVEDVAFVSVEVQGSFAAYRDGPWGQYDVAKAVETATGGALPRDHVIISSDHSHRGADTTGAWGGLPPAYMAYIAEQTKGAILDAYSARAPATLHVAAPDAGAFVTSDFPYPTQDVPDTPFRLLVARDATTGAVRGVYGTFSAHATLYGSAPRLSPDWPGVVSDMLGARLGDVPVVLGQGAVGRTHAGGERSTWEARLTDLLEEAVASAEPITTPGVDGSMSAVTLVGWNPILLGALHFGDDLCGVPANPVTDEFTRQSDISPCAPIGRADTAPWMVGNRITTLVSAARIGDVFVWGAPGELYPNAHWAVQERVDAREHFIVGLANDQLGYLIAPTEAWPLIVATVASDNGLFNVDAPSGDHVACAALDLARGLGFDAGAPPVAGSASVDDMPICATWAFEDRTLPP